MAMSLREALEAEMYVGWMHRSFCGVVATPQEHCNELTDIAIRVLVEMRRQRGDEFLLSQLDREHETPPLTRPA